MREQPRTLPLTQYPTGTMIRHAESHVDHVPAAVLEHVLTRFADRSEFFIVAIGSPTVAGGRVL